MRESKADAVNMTKERMIVLVKLRVALCRHTGMTHDDVYAVRNVNLQLASGKGTLINPQAVIEVVRNACRVCAAYLTFASKRIQNFVLRMGAQALLKVD